jgi:hypothetical protein
MKWMERERSGKGMLRTNNRVRLSGGTSEHGRKRRNVELDHGNRIEPRAVFWPLTLHSVASWLNNEGGQSLGALNVLGAPPPRKFFFLWRRSFFLLWRLNLMTWGPSRSKLPRVTHLICDATDSTQMP